MTTGMSVPTDDEIRRGMLADRKQRHAETHPDGCSDWCADCAERLTCKDGRHEWPNDYSDGDTCYCGAFYLIANSVDERPHIIETPRSQP